MHTVELPLLVLEPIFATHAEEMFEVLSDPAIYQFENQPPASVEALALRYSKWEARQSPCGTEQWLNWAVRHRASKKLMGFIQATVMPNFAYIAYEFNSQYWGAGYAKHAIEAMITELYDRYHVSTLVAVLKKTNYRSEGLLIRLGFTPANASLVQSVSPEPDELVMAK